ncbi:FGGY-family carbohydrate kinase [Evansella tamaricis]|uniref:Carbohydrate kinase n=1 Tax=Evansella tamaricis TaxID=2069301 RepID=A0ABS6JDA8_9BACI|nr:FGGY family carbohydrate kinase [Evansella tamaricis]MBU9711657.1 carbohydrate kinase [Evansella tamaricis]
MIIALDIGTTNLKAGLYHIDGTQVESFVVPMHQEVDDYQISFFSASKLWENVAQLIRDLAEKSPSGVSAISIASMAESGLMLNEESGRPITEILPWFETASLKQAKLIENEIDMEEQFFRTGLHVSYKFGLSKLLWLKEKEPSLFEQKVKWMSVSSYIAYCLTNSIVEEESLAVRTYAYDIKKQGWNEDLILHMGLQPSLFPDVQHCTKPVGEVLSEHSRLGIHSETKVYIAGHDHLVASLSIGELTPERIYNSIGTAETMVGVFPKRDLTRDDRNSGLTFGPHLLKDTYYWMGGHSSSGGSVEWLRDMISDYRLTYGEVMALLEQTYEGPTGILFFPYLNGSGAPYPNPGATASFIGLTKKHGKKELLKAVFEGNAYQMELIRRTAENVSDSKITKLISVGGGVKNRHWLQLKSDISGIPIEVPRIDEAVSIGAVLIAATGEGVYSSLEEAATTTYSKNTEIVSPNLDLNPRYRSLFEDKFVKLRGILAGVDG